MLKNTFKLKPKTKKLLKNILVFSLFTVIFSLGIISVQDVYADTVDSSFCTFEMGGEWQDRANTCIITEKYIPNIDLVIPNGITILIQNTGMIKQSDGDCGTITNSGKLIVTADGGIFNDGTCIIINEGTMMLTAPGNGGTSMWNEGTFINNGRLTIANTGYYEFWNAGMFTNNGQVTIESSGIHGIFNDNSGIITNNGRLTIANTGQFGITNFGTINNNDTITIKNESNHGIWHRSIGIITNEGTITIKHNGDLLYYGTIINEGKIKIQKDGSLQDCGGTLTDNGEIKGKITDIIHCSFY